MPHRFRTEAHDQPVGDGNEDQEEGDGDQGEGHRGRNVGKACGAEEAEAVD